MYKLYNNLKRPSEDEIKILIQKMISGDSSARDLLVELNIPLVIKYARRFNSKLPLDDLISAGTIGLMKGLEAFDPSFGTKLSTYLTPWILKHIRMEIRELSSIVRVPENATKLLSKALKQHENKIKDSGRMLPLIQHVKTLSEFDRETVRSAMIVTRPKAELYPASAHYKNQYTQLEDQEVIKTLLKRLTISDRRILEEIHGINGKTELTFSEYSKKYNMPLRNVYRRYDSALIRMKDLIKNPSLY